MLSQWKNKNKRVSTQEESELLPIRELINCILHCNCAISSVDRSPLMLWWDTTYRKPFNLTTSVGPPGEWPTTHSCSCPGQTSACPRCWPGHHPSSKHRTLLPEDLPTSQPPPWPPSQDLRLVRTPTCTRAVSCPNCTTHTIRTITWALLTPLRTWWWPLWLTNCILRWGLCARCSPRTMVWWTTQRLRWRARICGRSFISWARKWW